jgi:starch synthase
MLPFSYLIEDFLEKINVSLESYCTEMSGGWFFGYIEALKHAGVRTITICFSARVTKPTSFTNKPTGITMWVLPSPWIYRAVVRHIANPYGRNVEQAFGGVASTTGRCHAPGAVRRDTLPGI